MPSNHLILCCPLLLPSIFPSIRVFSNESTLHIRWPKYWSFSFSISPSNECELIQPLFSSRTKSNKQWEAIPKIPQESSPDAGNLPHCKTPLKNVLAFSCSCKIPATEDLSQHSLALSHVPESKQGSSALWSPHLCL